uniref:Small ribosomal subunit protein bS16c n=1 Tax=Dipterosiphonia australica TaxID=2007208 RepID=A0A1Z1MM50_9FLOR|nr:ribosomal protein S16 [Dipterosiphonia australica]ARW66929.1 ribosomal protein S16 [Dipterosiphonia australica]
MLKIRLKRLGRKKRPFYRIILIDSRKKRDGKAIKEIGFYNPLNKNYYINTIQVKKTIKQGAQITKTVQNIIKNNDK